MTDTALTPLAPWMWAALFGLWLGGSLLWRHHVGKPLWAARHADAAFSERWASARMGSGLLARLGTARHCMHIQVAQGQLEIHPHFPFTLGFMPEIYDLDHRIPLASIRSAVILSAGRTQAVEVKFTAEDGSEGIAQLLLRGAEPFVRAVLARPAHA